MTNKHIHAELMMEYAKDAMETDKPWERWEKCWDGYTWERLKDSPQWAIPCEYRRKKKTININGFDVPEPVKESEVEHGASYYSFNLTDNKIWLIVWYDRSLQIGLLELGILHHTMESAIKHREALLSFTKQGV